MGTAGGWRSSSGAGPAPRSGPAASALAPDRGQLGGPLGRGQVDADGDLRGLRSSRRALARLAGPGPRSPSRARGRPRSRRRSARSPACPGCGSARLGADHAAQDQPLAGPGRGDVEEAQLLLGLALLGLLAELVVGVEVDRGARRAGAAACPTRGSPPRGRGSAAAAREPASRPRERWGTATTPNSRPLALWTVMIRTPSWPSTAVAACGVGVGLGAGGEEVEQAAQVAALGAPRTRPPAASACGRWRSAPRPTGRISTARS